MAQLMQQFNADQMPMSENNFEPIPAGWYDVKISGAELKTTKAGNGQYIAVCYDVTAPTHQGRKVFGNLNISNPNSEAERIGHEQLGQLMRAIGLAQVSDTDQLIGGNCSIKVSISKSEQYGDSNDVKAWKAGKGGAMPQQSQAPQMPQQPQQPQMPAAGSTPPWQK